MLKIKLWHGRFFEKFLIFPAEGLKFHDFYEYM